jgi:curved DNA-binding protein CbpA
MENIRRMEDQYNKTKLKILNESDPYLIIGVEESAVFDDINKQYKLLAKEFHPDRYSNSNPQEKKEIELLFSKITSAFNLLKDPEERKKFDYEKRMRIKREEILKDIQNKSSGLSPFNTQSGSINLQSIFTDNKVDSQDIKYKKAENLFTGSLIKYNRGELDAAIADLQAAIELNPKVARYHSSLGLAMKEKGWTGYAMAEFKIALNFDPNDNLALEHYKNSPEKKNLDHRNQKSNEGILNRVRNLFKKT